MKLGIRQLELIRSVGTKSALVVADKTSRRLCDLGLMKEMGDGGFVCVTPDGLRALADAADAGRITLFTMPKKRTAE